jgi:succinyl-diaminopimelate desuccinylase
VDFYNKHIGFELDGASLGCKLSDGLSGPLILNVGTLSGDDKAAILTVNVRYPVTMDKEQVYGAMLPTIHRHNLGLVKRMDKPPVFTPPDSPLLKTLVDVYRRHTGDMESPPMVIGGGTYARAAANLVAFGPGFPGDPKVEHERDEYVSIDNLLKMSKIYAYAIYELSKPDEEPW